jgi:glycosyltransferase involved in cell wall biosynthesis
MKVLFFLRRIGPYHHARFLEAKKKVELVAVETRPGSDEYSWKFRPGEEYITEQFPVFSDPEVGIRGPGLHEAIDNVITKHRPDVIVNTGWADSEYNGIVVHAASKNIPVVVISDSKKDAVSRRFYVEWVKGLVIRAYSSAVVAGTLSADYMMDLGFPGDAIFKPWDVVDNEYFHRASIQTSTGYSARKFLCVARFIEEKNLNRLLDAYSAYVTEGGARRLVLIGGGYMEMLLKSQINALGIGHMIEMHGFVQQEQLVRHFSEAIALILPSLSEQWGLVVNEAMASSLPVLVSSKCGCAVDLVDENRNGIIFDPLDVQAIKQSMKQMDVLSETRWSDMGRESFSIIGKWGLREFSDGLEAACTYALRSPRRKPVVLLHKLLAR